jgi:hypothetical protein
MQKKFTTSIHRFTRIAVTIIFILFARSIITWAAASIAQDESVEWRIEHIAGVKVVEVRTLLTKLKEAVGKNDRKAVCGLIQYPLRSSGGMIHSVSSCEARYGTIFNDKVISAIAKQRFEDLFVNWQGVMIGNGEVWMSGVCKDKECNEHDFGIVTVNN